MHYLVQQVGYAIPTWEPQHHSDDPPLIRSYFATLATLPHSRDLVSKSRPRTAPTPANVSVIPPLRADFDPTILPAFAVVPPDEQQAALAAPAPPSHPSLVPPQDYCLWQPHAHELKEQPVAFRPSTLVLIRIDHIIRFTSYRSIDSHANRLHPTCIMPTT